MVSCGQSGNAPENHFAGAGKMVEIGSGSNRKVSDFHLSRFACYLIAQNGDPRKPEIAAAQKYFAIQARRQEISDALAADLERLEIRKQASEEFKALSGAAREAGVQDRMFGIFHDAGYKGLYTSLDDCEKAQALSDSFRVDDLKQALDIFAARYCPVIKKFELAYHWSIMQVEYATDIMFKERAYLNAIYEPLVRTAIHSVKPENIATFLGRKLHSTYQGEMGNNFNTRIMGTRIKHQMGASSIKMYDKFGHVLRIETTTNDVSQFKCFRDVLHHDGSIDRKNAPMKKGIYSMHLLSGLLKASNRRYMEFVSTFDGVSGGINNLRKVSETVVTDKRTYKGFNFFAEDDVKLLVTLERGEFNISGFQNKTLHRFLADKSSGQISRILKRLNKHGIIRKIGKTYKYYLTRLGKAVIATGLIIKEMSIIPQLAKACG